MVSRLRTKTRKREARLFAARTTAGFYVDVSVYIHETAFRDDEWVETGRSYRLSDGTQVHAGALGELTIATTGEVQTRL